MTMIGHPWNCQCAQCVQWCGPWGPPVYTTPGPWTCPKCNSIYGPMQRECYRCNAPVTYTVTSSSPTGMSGTGGA